MRQRKSANARQKIVETRNPEVDIWERLEKCRKVHGARLGEHHDPVRSAQPCAGAQEPWQSNGTRDERRFFDCGFDTCCVNEFKCPAEEEIGWEGVELIANATNSHSKHVKYRVKLWHAPREALLEGDKWIWILDRRIVDV